MAGKKLHNARNGKPGVRGALAVDRTLSIGY